MRRFERYNLLFCGYDSHYKKLFIPSITIITATENDDITQKIIEDLNSKYRKHKYKEIDDSAFEKEMKKYKFWKSKSIKTGLGFITGNIYINGNIITKE